MQARSDGGDGAAVGARAHTGVELLGVHTYGYLQHVLYPGRLRTMDDRALGGHDARAPVGRGNLSSTYLLARTNLSDEQKLQVALCRRQCWLRAAQLAPVGALASYAAAAMVHASPWASARLRLPRGTRLAAGGRP